MCLLGRKIKAKGNCFSGPFPCRQIIGGFIKNVSKRLLQLRSEATEPEPDSPDSFDIETTALLLTVPFHSLIPPVTMVISFDISLTSKRPGCEGSTGIGVFQHRIDRLRDHGLYFLLAGACFFSTFCSFLSYDAARKCHSRFLCKCLSQAQCPEIGSGLPSTAYLRELRLSLRSHRKDGRSCLWAKATPKKRKNKNDEVT